MLLLLSCGLLIASTPRIAHADLSFNLQQTGKGWSFIEVSGQFETSDDISQLRYLAISSAARVVVFDSPGGNVLKAMELGRLVRSLGLVTVQIRNFDCASACALAFMGGVQRVAEPGSIGMHKASFSGELSFTAHEAVAAVQQMTALIIAYMIEMGVDPGLLQVALQYESSDMRYLSASEMEQFRLTTDADNVASAPATIAPTPYAPDRSSQKTAALPSYNPALRPSPSTGPYGLARAESGRVRHKDGYAPMKLRPEAKSTDMTSLRNGQPVQILGSIERWYQVRSGTMTGYMHHTWIFVDQYVTGPFEARYIQIKSFDNLADLEAFVRSFPIKLSAYRASNGWYAVTLAGTYDRNSAIEITRRLKAERSIPQDSYVTYGNTYMQRVCCN
ncbi:hypothetical protein H2509_01890 [Stappia sp. F7233]|uniref:SH3b domain-containing protein n=1 Tax=Stappia albiluteola TaxID=2758565 RepID=A0A839AAB9_9HYPH|nr:SH3 domain-containing protein [Stappia albiluteola]MBA5775872.1 hypothetical protein [Stappia albiluteola]